MESSMLQRVVGSAGFAYSRAAAASRVRLPNSAKCLAPTVKLLQGHGDCSASGTQPRAVAVVSMMAVPTRQLWVSSRPWVLPGMVGNGGASVYRKREHQPARKGANLGQIQGRRGSIVTMAIPADVYWVTVFQATAVSVLMFFGAIIGGILLNISVEKRALLEYQELVEKGVDVDALMKADATFNAEEPLYIFNSSDIAPRTRNRPVREESDPELEQEQEKAQQVPERDGVSN